MTAGTIMYDRVGADGLFHEESFTPLPNAIVTTDEDGKLTSSTSGGPGSDIPAASVTSTPSGEMTPTNVDAALADLEARKATKRFAMKMAAAL